MKNQKNSRTRIYGCVVYPDSAPEDWLSKISSEYVPTFVSPLHDKDIDQTGEGQKPKKPHYHVMVMYDGVKTKEQFEEFEKKFGGVGCEIIASKRGYARYLCHLDNPEKQKYNIEDVLEFSGADYKDAIARDSDKYKSIKAMISFIKNQHITSYCQFMDYCMDYEPEWYSCLVSCGTYVISTYITELRKEDKYL